MTLLLVCSIIVVAVIIFGTVTRTNIGLWAIFAAYVLGSFVLGINPSLIINMWPTKLFLMLFAVTFFYSFAILNGSLEKLACTPFMPAGPFPGLFPSCSTCLDLYCRA
jgi:hypothetical protein